MRTSFNTFGAILFACALRVAVAQGANALTGDQANCLNQCISSTPIAPCAVCVSYSYPRSHPANVSWTEVTYNVPVPPHRMSEPKSSRVGLAPVEFQTLMLPASTTRLV
jgi:hypothetical protein